MAPFPTIDFILLLGTSPVGIWWGGYMIGMLVKEWARRAGPPRLGTF